MKRLVTIGVVAVAILIALIALIFRQQMLAEDPTHILSAIRNDQGDQEDLIMRFKLARGDRVGPMIDAVNNKTARTAFRALIVDMLFEQNKRAPDERIAPILSAALHDDDPVIRRRAAHGFAFFADEKDQAPLIDAIRDPDEEVRMQAYMVLGAVTRSSWEGAQSGVWEDCSDEKRDEIARTCLAMADKESSEHMRFLARGVAGRRIEIWTREAAQAVQSGDLGKALDLLGRAAAMDPENRQAKIGMLRYHLAVGDRDKAIAYADSCGALFRVPLLPAPPTIDGKPDDDAWKSGLTNPQNFFRNTSRWIGRPAEGKTKAAIGHHGGKIYILVVGYEEELEKLSVKHTERDSDVWNDDCVELFFDPGKTGQLFYQFCINTANVVQDWYKTNKKFNFPHESATAVDRERGYWVCEFAIDANDLGGSALTPNSLWGLNIVRSRIGPGAEQTAWWPTFGGSNKPDLFPIAVFAGL